MLKGWKTLMFSVATALFGVAQMTDWGSVIQNPKVAGAVLTGVGVANALLRAITTTPIGSSTPSDKPV